MADSDSKRHHWWPECISRRWAGDDRCVARYRSDGTTLRLRPNGLGVIGNGHYIKLGKEPGEVTPFDQNFEHIFNDADDGTPAVIDFLEGLNFEERFGSGTRDRFLPCDISDVLFERLVEALVGLAVRSPMTREAAVRLAESLRGPLPTRERNALITMNLRDMHKNAFRSLRGRGKVAVILSPGRELIFGDGFYHNLNSSFGPPSSARILAPITPRIAVLYAVPRSYRPLPRASTIVVDAQEASMLNEVIQIYSRECIFFRSEMPAIRDDFALNSHRKFASIRNPIEDMVHDMPGVPPYDDSLDW